MTAFKNDTYGNLGVGLGALRILKVVQTSGLLHHPLSLHACRVQHGNHPTKYCVMCMAMLSLSTQSQAPFKNDPLAHSFCVNPSNAYLETHESSFHALSLYVSGPILWFVISRLVSASYSCIFLRLTFPFKLSVIPTPKIKYCQTFGTNSFIFFLLLLFIFVS